ncbi:hypothetical protein AgCh_028276 [Apium graveolens]
MTVKQLSDRLEKIEVKTETKRKNNRNGKVGINKHNNYTPDKYAPRKICVMCGSVNHLSVNCKSAMPTPISVQSQFPNMNVMPPMPVNAVPTKNMNAQFANMPFAPNPYYAAYSMPQMPFSMPYWNNMFTPNMPFHVSHNMHDNSVALNGFKGPTPMTKEESEIPKRNLWYLDSGCSRHRTGDSTLPTEFKERAGPSITFGDDSKGYTVGYGLISKDNVIIEEVALVDGLKHNLLSISQLCDKGNSVTFCKEACVVTNNQSNKVVLTGVRRGNMYLADFNSTKAGSVTCLLSKASQDESWLWHKKLSHLNFKTMNELVKKELVRGIPLVEFSKDGLCDACQKGKQIKASFRKKLDSTIEEPLQLLHMDLFGPVNVLSISRKRFCLVIVDDFPKFSWTYFLKSKDETSEIIINHIRQVNNHPDFKVRRIRSDNGTKFKNSIMRAFCEENGILHQFSAARTPQQNGVVERKNRSLIEAARTMLEESKLPTYFWAEAVSTAIVMVLEYILTIIPLSSLINTLLPPESFLFCKR